MMILTFYILSLLVIFLLAGAIPVVGGIQTVIFQTPVFIVIDTCLCLLMLYCVLKRKPSLLQTGFYLAHIGVVIVLAGAFIGLTRGIKSDFAVPLMPQHKINEIPILNEKPLKLDFSIGASDFRVKFYEPQYNLYKPVKSADGEIIDYIFVEKFQLPTSGALDLKDFGEIERSALSDPDGNWTKQHVLPNDYILQAALTPRHYSVNLSFTNRDGTEQKALAVNSPATYDNWRFYLMSYDQEASRYVVLSARNDPGRRLVITGIWFMIAGIALLCWRKDRRTGKSDA